MAAAQSRVVIDTYGPNSTVETRESEAPGPVEVAPDRSVPVAARYIEAGPGTILSPSVSVIPLELSPVEEGARKVLQIQDAAGQVWLRAQGGTLFRLDTTSGLVSLISNVSADDMAIADDGVAWLAGREQICRVVASEVEIFRFSAYVSPEAIALSADGTVWVGGHSSGREPILLRFETGIWTAFGPGDGLPYLGSVDYLAIEPSGAVWGGIRIEGLLPLGESLKEPVPTLVSFDGDRWAAYHLGNVVPSRTAPESLLVDRFGHVWMASDGRVVHKDGSDFLVYERGGAPWDEAVSLSADAESGVWVGGYGGPFGRLVNGRWYALGGTSQERLPLQVQDRVTAAHSPEPGQTWVWDAGGTLSRVRALRPTGVLERPEIRPGGSGLFELGLSFPNPFNASTTLVYSVPQQEEVSLRVYSTSGQLVDATNQGRLGPGAQKAVWHGRDLRGQPVASGVYVLALTAGDLTRARAVTVLK